MAEVKIIQNVLKHNDEIAAMNRQRLHEAGVYCIDLIGAPGCGKTALLEATLDRLADRMRIGIVAGDLATDRDAQRMQAHGGSVVQVNTGKGCHLDANQVRHALDNLDLNSLDLVIIENVGNLICPVGFDLGQDCKVGMFSVCSGDDKPAKHPHLVVAADLLLLNKIDLIEHMRFDRDVFVNDVKMLNPSVELIETSVVNNRVDQWIDWLTSRTHAAKASDAAAY
ncbi:MAG: hydrogenase nickel incorporation protein HypB [Phycisphaeraceae bacterium]